MSTIAIVGAGPGLGMSIAREFGFHGFNVALIARTQNKLDQLVEELGAAGIEAAGFAADIMQRDTLDEALQLASERFGGIDVLEFSPAPGAAAADGLGMVDVMDVTVETMRPQLDYYLNAGITAARAVLPGMLERRSGTLLFTSGAGSVTPIPMMGNINAASAALRNWVINLHNPLREHGIHAEHIAIGVYINSGSAETAADTIAKTYWDAYQRRDGAERVYTVDVTAP
ncbi:SDR family NAD(P)-dependent oxidoreductase [Curtobacterium sp. NPDC089689]|uniref:SDR family NAD(P)-dependent oxidoreductase n=1 Tax=Curtobacterium sp. NPDC089689 TaxID=3363968 RepID=UPI0037F9CB27